MTGLDVHCRRVFCAKGILAFALNRACFVSNFQSVATLNNEAAFALLRTH